MLYLRMRNAGLKRPCRFKDHKPFAITIEPAARIRTLFRHIGATKSGARSFGALISELRRTPKGFVDR